MLTFVCLSGPLAGQSFSLGEEALSIGRGPESLLQLPDVAASRRHCVLEPTGAGYRLRDLASRRGTFVNGVPVQERLLADGDLVTIGRSLFVFQTGEDGAGRSWPALILAEGEDPAAETTVYLAPADALYVQPPEVVGERAATEGGGRIARDLRTLLEIGTDLQALTSTSALGRRLLELVLAAVPGERAALLLTDRGTAEPGESVARDSRGPAPPFPISRTVVRRVLDERVGLLAQDVLQEEGLAAAESLKAGRVRSLIAVPLLQLGQPLGLLYLDVQDLSTRLDESHLQLVAAMAGTAASALAAVRRMEWLEQEARRLAGAFDHDMVGESPRMREVYHLLRRAAATDSTVLLRGESGTGKELAARALHRESPRADRPFVAVNCATLSETLLESELFGHERGAFTGAVARQTGKVEAADTGALFLDEVGEIPLSLQAKLLRFLQEREFERVGGTGPIRVDVRVVAATNRDLEKMVREGAFREDLFYRLDVITLRLPPLRERQEDVLLLASHFAARTGRRLGREVAGFTPEARACLLRHGWPGNVRELANAIERALVLGAGDLIRPEDLPESLLETGPPAAAAEAAGAAGRTETGEGTGAAGTGYHEALNAAKRRLILDALAAAGGNVTRASSSLGLHPNYLHRLISNLGLRADLKA